LRGAKTSDLIDAKGYDALFLERWGRRPRLQWHVINAFRGRDPSTRPEPFAGHEDVVAAFGGLIIDTRSLFLMIRDLRRGDLSPEDARALLWNSDLGLYQYFKRDDTGD